MGNEESKKRVFVRNLDSTTSDNEFVSYFQKRYGVDYVEGGKIVRDLNGRSKGFGFISFVSAGTANDVVSERNHIIGGKRVVCKIASPKKNNQNVDKQNLTPQHLREIYVGNLNTDLTLRQLKDYFSYFGAIENASLVCDDNQKPLGYGYIEFQTTLSIDEIQNNRPHVLNGREIQTVRCYPRHTSANKKKPSTVLYVLNYDQIDENVIEDYFTQFGDVIFVARKEIRPQGVKYMEIQFEDYDSVDVVCLADNHVINGRKVTVTKQVQITSDFDHIQDTPRRDDSRFSSFSGSSYQQSAFQSPTRNRRTYSFEPVNERENEDCVIL